MKNLMKQGATNTRNGNAVAVAPGGSPPPRTAVVVVGLVVAAVAALLARKCLRGN